MKNSESSWNLTSVVSRYISSKLKTLMQPYLENITIDTLVSLRPIVALTDIMMREDALDKLSLPIRVSKQSRVSLLKLSLPVTAYNSMPVKVKLNKVRAFVVPNEGKWLDATRNKEKFEKLAAWREEQKSELSESEKKGFFTKLIETVVNNFRLAVRDMEIVYLDKVSLGHPCFFRIHIGQLKVKTVNSEWQPTFSLNERETFRLITIHNFSVAVVADIAEKDLKSSDLHDYYHNITLSERHYLLKPCKIVIKHTLNHMDKSQSVKIKITGLEVALSEMQMQFIKHCVRFFEFKRSYTRYHVARPEVALKVDRRAWWQYLVKATKMDLCAKVKQAMESEKQRMRYIELYKRHQDIIHAPWLETLNKKEVEEVHMLEDVLQLRLLLAYRSAALKVLRVEASEYAKQRSHIEGTTNITELWSHYTKDFKDSLTSGEPSQIEPNESLASTDRQISEGPTFSIKVKVSYFLFLMQKTCGVEWGKTQIYENNGCECAKCKNPDFVTRPSIMQPEHLDSSGRDSIEDSDDDHADEHHGLLPELRNLREYNTSSDSIKEVQQITSAKPDPRLFGEQTLFVLHLDKITGKVDVFGSGAVRCEEPHPIRVGKIWMWDLASLCEEGLRNSFLGAYGLKNLLSETIERNLSDLALFCAMRYFMQQSNLESYFEFYVHFKDIIKNKNSSSEKQTFRCCNCGRFYSEETLFDAAFRDEDSPVYIHMPNGMRPDDPAEMGLIASYMEEIFRKDVLPFFVRRFARWIFPSIISRNATEVQSKKAKHKSVSEKDILEVSFAMIKEKRRNSTDSEAMDRASATSRLRVSLDSPMLMLTNTFISAVLQWMQPQKQFESAFKKKPLVDSFLAQLRRKKETLSFVSSICTEAKKDLDRQSRDLRELLQAEPDLSIDFEIANIRILLLDDKNLSKYRDTQVITIDLERIALRYLSPVSAVGPDLRCYRQVQFEAGGVFVSALERKILRTSAKMLVLSAIPKTSMELPDLVVDFHVPELVLELNLSMFPLLAFLQGIDPPQKPKQAKDSFAQQMEANIKYGMWFRVDFNRTKELLLSHDYPFTQATVYTTLRYLKYQKVIYLSLGSVAGNSGLSVIVNPNEYLSPLLVVRVPLIVADFHEKCFSQVGSVLISDIELEHTEGERIQIEVTQSTQSVFPVIPAVVFPVLPFLKVALGAAEAQEERKDPDVHMQEVLVIRQKKIPFTEDFPENELLRPRCERNSFTDLETRSMALVRKTSYRSSNVEIRSELDQLTIKIRAVRFLLYKPLFESRVMASVLGVLSILETCNRLRPVPSFKPAPSSSKLDLFIEVGEVSLQSLHPQASLEVKLEGIKVTSKIQRKHKSNKGKKVRKVLTFETNRLSVEMRSPAEEGSDDFPVDRLIATVLNFSGSIEAITKGSNPGKAGNIRIGKLSVSVSSNEHEEPLLLVPSELRHDVIAPLTGDSTKIDINEQDDTITVRVNPVVVALEAEVIVGVKKFILRYTNNAELRKPWNPEELVKDGDGVFPLKPTSLRGFQLDIFSVQALFIVRKEHFLRLGLDNVILRNAGEGKLMGTVDNLHLETKFAEYPDIVKKLGAHPMLEFQLFVPEKLIAIFSKNIQFVFLNRMVEDLIGFIKKLKTPKKEGDAVKPPTQDFTVELTCEDATVLVPNSSTGKEILRLQAGRVFLRNSIQSLCLLVPQKLARDFEFVKKKEVIVETSESTQEFFCDAIMVKGEAGVLSLLRPGTPRKLCEVESAEITVFSATSLPATVREVWNLDVRVEVNIRNGHLTVSLKDMMKLINILEVNIDEKTELFEKIFKWEKTDFRVEWGKGTIGTSRWNCKKPAQGAESGNAEMPIAQVQALSMDGKEEEAS